MIPVQRIKGVMTAPSQLPLYKDVHLLHASRNSATEDFRPVFSEMAEAFTAADGRFETYRTVSLARSSEEYLREGARKTMMNR